MQPCLIGYVALEDDVATLTSSGEFFNAAVPIALVFAVQGSQQVDLLAEPVRFPLSRSHAQPFY
jgi:hypothetical protein